MNKSKKSILYLSTLFSSMLLASVGNCTTTVTFSATQSNPTTFTGFGAMVWDGPTGTKQTLLQQLYQLPGFRVARINHDIRNVTVPNNLTSTAAYLALWNSNGDPATDLQLPVGQGGTYQPIQFLWLADVPCTFIQSNGYGNVCPANCGNGGCTLISGVNLQSLAYYLAAGVQHFNQVYGALNSCANGATGCYSANYVELSNEPDGNWDVQFTAAQYNTLIQDVYAALKTISPNTLITGPGVSKMDWSSTGTDTFVTGLSTAGLADLGAWSVHNYIDTLVSGTPEENLDPTSTTINGYGDTADRYWFSKWYAKPKSLGATKPVIVSEMSTKATGFHKIKYSAPTVNDACASPQTSSNCSIIDTTSYGVRMYTYAISLLAGGANSILSWEAYDQSWEAPGGGFGIYNLNNQPRPFYYAMLPLWQNLQPGSKVLVSPTTQNANDIYSVAFLSPNNANGTVNCVTLALANGGTTSGVARTTTVTGLPTTAIGYTATTQLFSQLGTTVYQGQLTTDPNASFTLSKGTLTYTTKLSEDQAVTAQVCLTY
ncbi:MAG: hypothetical protein ACHP6H_00890 [Legionellales bacterium]